DDDAAGRGWFIDATPDTNEEFTLGTASHLLGAIAGGVADGRVDLLTVITHELGHGFGLDDLPRGLEPRLMSETLGLGERRLVSALDLITVAPPAGGDGAEAPEIPTVTLQPLASGPASA